MGQVSIDKNILEWFNRVNFYSKSNPMEAKMSKKTTTNHNTEIKSFENNLKALGQLNHIKQFYFKKCD